MPRKTKEDARLTREKILKGALQVFVKKGFSNTTLQDIARHIGMTRGAVYWHFKDKQDLATAMIAEMMEKEAAYVKGAIQPTGSLDDIIANLMARLDYVDANPEMRQFVFFMSFQVEWATERQINIPAKENPFRHGPFGNIYDLLVSAREAGEIRPEVDLLQVHDIITGLYMGLVRLEFSGKSQTPLRSNLEWAAKAVIDSIRSEGSGSLQGN